MKKMYAVCGTHAQWALRWFMGKSVEIKPVSPEDVRFRCKCGHGAEFLLTEVMKEEE